MSMVKLLIAEKDSRRGYMYSSNAASMSQLAGVAVGVKRENVRWYVLEYFKDRVVHFASESATSGARALGDLSGGAELVDRR